MVELVVSVKSYPKVQPNAQNGPGADTDVKSMNWTACAGRALSESAHRAKSAMNAGTARERERELQGALNDATNRAG